MSDMSKANFLEVKDLCLYYDQKKYLKNINLSITKNKILALIGPSGCGKSSLLRCFNRMNDFVANCRITGEIFFKGQNIYSKGVEPVKIRTQIGMVFQEPTPFPKSIYQNIIWGPRINRVDFDPDELVELSLRQAALWDEVKDRLHSSALKLSGGQQQRLCIARTLAMKSEVILMDEPCSSLDPRSTDTIEQLLAELSQTYTIMIVTHNLQQAGRLSDETCFICDGDIIEKGLTKDIFTSPKEKQTERYIMGRFG